MRANSLSSVEQIGQTVVEEEEEEEAWREVEACCEWQAGVLRAERPAERATWRRGRDGREWMVLCVWTKRVER